MFKIIIPAGFPCLYVGGLLGKGEREVLLPPCTTFVVTNVEANGNLITLRPIKYQSIYINKKDIVDDLLSYYNITYGSMEINNEEDYIKNEKIKSRYEKEFNEYKCKTESAYI